MTIYLISGANRGLGLALAERLSKEGNNTIIAGARNLDSASELRAAAERSQGKIHAIQLDQTKKDSVDAAISEIETKFGSIDVLINNAGVNFGPNTAASKVSDGDLIENFNTNVVGVARLTTAALPLLRKGKGKQIYTIASILGSSGSIIGMGQSVGTAYGISKAAVTFYMVSLAQDLKSEGFIVQPIHPGWVKTDMGGDGADITIDESIDGIVSLLAKMTTETPVALYTYNGNTLPF